ncbi:ATP-dependent DNA helicase RecG [Candidatus Woesebacteria bacterium]|nr:ATP-dependent DNA helicase RecG [Candidatus Woesebacteria bacterium]
MDLSSSIEELSFVGPIYARKCEKLGIKTIEDLLLHAPHRYDDFSLVSPISRVELGKALTVKGKLESLKNQYTKSGRKIQIGEVSDSTGKITVIWFNQPFLTRALYPGTEISLSGKVDFFGNKRALISPEYEILSENKSALHTGRLVPVYPETSGLSSKWLRGRIKDALEKSRTNLKEYLPQKTLRRLNLEGLLQSIESMHFPKDLVSAQAARRRLAFNELIFLQLKSLYKKLTWQKNKISYKLAVDNSLVDRFIGSLPFRLTPSQERTVEEILYDLGRNYPMNRLLEGDVGSGKTVVAAIAAFVTFTSGFQTVFMAPTQILAQQHYETLTGLFEAFNLRVSLITSDIKKANLGRADIFVGTHALIHSRISFDQVGLVVIDEQHRFGVEQRAHLVKKSGKKISAPHVLTMTATPIPRTVALSFYGDLDLSTLDELPKGRQKITTWVVPPVKRVGAYEWIKKEVLKNKTQAFVICPLIEDSENETMRQVKAAKSEYLHLKKTFKSLRLGLIHGKLSAKEKNQVLADFRSGKIDVLVSTPVVEVGIDIPNATIMLIEAAERFGLAQLHQLRGRVGRGDKKSYCLLFSEVNSQKAMSRLNAMTQTVSGFELAELDLKLRGPGEIFGTAQSGFPELKIASWGDFDLIKSARQVAEYVIQHPTNYRRLISLLKDKQLVSN